MPMGTRCSRRVAGFSPRTSRSGSWAQAPIKELALGTMECQSRSRPCGSDDAPGGTVTDQDELDERKASILRAIVEEYVETAQPVGSQTVARSRDRKSAV